MPTYEYACAACQHEFEAFQSIKDAPLTACPKCGADQARRQISRGTGFILKGGGWYSDLYSSTKKDGGSSGGGSDSGSSGSGTSGSGTSGSSPASSSGGSTPSSGGSTPSSGGGGSGTSSSSSAPVAAAPAR